MTEPAFVSLTGVPGFPLAPGAIGRALWGERGMLNLVELEAGAEVALHSHPHEQLGLILSGTMTMTVGGVTHELAPMDAYVVPGGMEHGGTAGADGAVLVDVFVPVREDYRDAAEAAQAAR